MVEIYGHKWTSAYGDSTDASGAAGTWAKGLAGITPKQVGDGLKACVVSSDPWPPTLPEFRAMCLGVPSLAAVRLDVKRVSPFTVLVWENLNGYLYKQSSADKADKMLKDAYEVAREYVMRGGQLPDAPVAEIAQEEKPKWTPPSEEERLANVARAREELGL